MLLFFPVFLWAQNDRTVIPTSSDLYKYADRICFETGRTVAESARPWTSAEFLDFLLKIDYQALSDAGKKAYDYIERAVSDKKTLFQENKFAFDTSVTVSPEAFYHIEVEDSEDEAAEDYVWQHGYEERQSFITVPLELWYADSLYLLMNLELKEEHNSVNCSSVPEVALNNYNIIIDDPSFWVDTYFPFRAVMSSGGEGWDLLFGRDDLSTGSGSSGNLVLSDYSDYYDFLMFKLRSDSIAFTSYFILMDHYNSVEGLEDDTEAVVSHRLDFSFWDGRIRAAVSESSALSDISWETLRDMNFLMIYHDGTQYFQLYQPRSFNVSAESVAVMCAAISMSFLTAPST